MGTLDASQAEVSCIHTLAPERCYSAPKIFLKLGNGFGQKRLSQNPPKLSDDPGLAHTKWGGTWDTAGWNLTFG